METTSHATQIGDLMYRQFAIFFLPFQRRHATAFNINARSFGDNNKSERLRHCQASSFHHCHGGVADWDLLYNSG